MHSFPFNLAMRLLARFGEAKETSLERTDFTLQLPMFVTEEKEGQMFIVLFISCFR